MNSLVVISLKFGSISYFLLCTFYQISSQSLIFILRKFKIWLPGAFRCIKHKLYWGIKTDIIMLNVLICGIPGSMRDDSSRCLNFFHLLVQKPNLETNSIYSNKFFHIFHLFQSSFTCSGLLACGLVQRLQ